MHHGGRFFAQRRVGDTHQRGIGYRRVIVKNVLHFGRIDVLAPTDDHVLRAVDDIAPALLVEPRKVAGAHPAVDKGFGGRLGAVPIAFHHHWAARPQLADFAGFQFAVIVPDDLEIRDRDRRPAAVRPVEIILA